MTIEEVVALAIIGIGFGVTCLATASDAARILRSRGFVVGALVLLVGAQQWVESRGSGLGTLVFVFPVAYVLAGLLAPPRPYLTGFLLSLVHLACVVLVFALTPHRPYSQMDGLAQMGADIFDALLIVLIPVGSGLVMLMGTVVTGVSAGVRQNLHQRPSGG